LDGSHQTHRTSNPSFLACAILRQTNDQANDQKQIRVS
jgi:hypothetical protein